jgi:hypothetical protein
MEESPDVGGEDCSAKRPGAASGDTLSLPSLLRPLAGGWSNDNAVGGKGRNGSGDARAAAEFVILRPISTGVGGGAAIGGESRGQRGIAQANGQRQLAGCKLQAGTREPPLHTRGAALTDTPHVTPPRSK